MEDTNDFIYIKSNSLIEISIGLILLIIVWVICCKKIIVPLACTGAELCFLFEEYPHIKDKIIISKDKIRFEENFWRGGKTELIATEFLWSQINRVEIVTPLLGHAQNPDIRFISIKNGHQEMSLHHYSSSLRKIKMAIERKGITCINASKIN